MTLILRYVDQQRIIVVGDTRITLSENGKVIGWDDLVAAKSLFTCGYLISYSGLAVLNHYDEVSVTTREWVTASLREAQAEDKEINQTLSDMASVLSSNAVIAPEFSGSALEIDLIGISPAPEGFDPEDGAEFVFDEDFSFEKDDSKRYALVAVGRIANTHSTGALEKFDGWAEHYVPDPARPYASYGVELSQSLSDELDSQISSESQTIDIINLFIATIRTTAMADDSVGRDLTVAVLPLSALADAMGTGSLLYSERVDELIPEGYVAHAFVKAGVQKAVMWPAEQVNFIETDQAPSPGGLMS